jgi:tryptophanyl-tRNA synthetase
VTLPELLRNPTVKAEQADAGITTIGGLLLTYPVHQAADICFCHGNLVPVGRDQLPHLEQTRAIVRRFNDRYAGGQAVLTEPQALLSAAPALLGADGRKMSKSRGNAITLRASEDETVRVIRRAVTDADRHISYDPHRRPEVSSLVLTAALCRDEDPHEVAAAVGGRGAAALKALAAEAVNEHLRPIRRRRAQLAADRGFVREVLAAGNARANQLAATTLQEVQAVLGMRY